MLVIKVIGGLCNNMFQYALYKSLEMKGRNAVLDNSTWLKEWRRAPWHLYSAFGIEECRRRQVYETFKRWSLFEALKHKLKRYREGEFEKNLEVIFGSDDLYLIGYWQSEKYFADRAVQDELRRVFATPRKYWESESFVRWHKLITGRDSTSIHIRRGDYIADENRRIYGGICTEQYYRKAVEMIRQREPDTVFYIFSDDKEYARQFADGSRFILVDDKGLDDHHELFLMSYCRHHILANSSFSWWGSWLNEQEGAIVIAPDRWDNVKNRQEIYRDNMIRIADE